MHWERRKVAVLVGYARSELSAQQPSLVKVLAPAYIAQQDIDDATARYPVKQNSVCDASFLFCTLLESNYAHHETVDQQHSMHERDRDAHCIASNNVAANTGLQPHNNAHRRVYYY